MKGLACITALPALILAASISAILVAQVLPLQVDKIVNMGPEINTPFDDFAPSFTADGNTMVFNSKRLGEPYQNIYICRREGGRWTEARAIAEINSPYNDETPFITPDGAFIFFASDRDGSLEMPADASGRIRVSYDIYVSQNIQGRWQRPIRLPGTVNTAHHERSPCLSRDMTALYYTTWPFGNIERAYIMSAEYREDNGDGSFVNPRPMPSPINTGQQDISLSPAPDGKGFFFSSRRPGGYGGWDLYFAPLEDGRIGPPVNLGPGINSPGNDVHLSIIGDSLYFCSNREGGMGLYDIYSSTIVKAEPLTIIVRDKKTGKPVETELNLFTRVEREGAEALTAELKKRTDSRGRATITYNPAVKSIDLNISEKGYLPLFETIDIVRAAGKPLVLELSPIEKEARFDIHAIHFDFESARIKPESIPYLDALADYLKKSPSLRFQIVGHTDLHGADSFNKKLSLERARAVRDYLVNKGIDASRLTVRGAGASEPKVHKKGPGHDEQNRRTEFRLIE
ncbi:MAG TPA: OmpA family protein [Spirochaetota bacterium]|nr:MAG: Outer membrane porin F precursor [Spirochaetes bacterium ADurb.BinA120]HPI13025.1 OmpA family protein [Spirochaetota bacterium]